MHPTTLRGHSVKPEIAESRGKFVADGRRDDGVSTQILRRTIPGQRLRRRENRIRAPPTWAKWSGGANFRMARSSLRCAGCRPRI